MFPEEEEDDDDIVLEVPPVDVLVVVRAGKMESGSFDAAVVVASDVIDGLFPKKESFFFGFERKISSSDESLSRMTGGFGKVRFSTLAKGSTMV